MSDYPTYRGWDILGRATRGLKQSLSNVGKSSEARQVDKLADKVAAKLRKMELDSVAGRRMLAADMAEHVLANTVEDGIDIQQLPFFSVLANCIAALLEDEAFFTLPPVLVGSRVPDRSEIWEIEDQLKKISKILDDLNTAIGDIANIVRRQGIWA